MTELNWTKDFPDPKYVGEFFGVRWLLHGDDPDKPKVWNVHFGKWIEVTYDEKAFGREFAIEIETGMPPLDMNPARQGVEFYGPIPR